MRAFGRPRTTRPRECLGAPQRAGLLRKANENRRTKRLRHYAGAGWRAAPQYHPSSRIGGNARCSLLAI